MTISKTWRKCVLALAAAVRAAAQDVPTPPESAAASDKPSFYVEAGGSYSGVSNTSPWTGQDFKVGYLGSKRFAPFFTVSSQNRGDGAQQNYGAYSYVTLSKRVWAMVGASGSPEGKATLYPTFRTGGNVYVGVLPKVPGLFLSAGYSDVWMGGGGGARIASAGAMYYGKVILSGSINVNQSRPGNSYSRSFQGAAQVGRQGKYWLGGGFNGGNAAYQLIGQVPLDVRFNAVAVNVFYQRWLTRRFGLIWRYDYANEMGFFRRHGAYVATFFEF
jgi:YaiO family outer membrane protein